ncbi:MAG TPA: hypothetical protein VHR66_05535 [Gemmataceae bacterium]|jgi:formylglycine-generating enzyme required for sulfatase activity|nr:hypothetical protein [Gemmataceae bacterium]
MKPIYFHAIILGSVAFAYVSQACRSAARSFAGPDFRSDSVGFRVALSPPE